MPETLRKLVMRSKGLATKSNGDGTSDRATPANRPPEIPTTNISKVALAPNTTRREYSGFSHIFQPQEGTTQKLRTLVVLVHGIGGHWRDSWIYEDFNWVERFLQVDLKDAGLAAEFCSYGYDSRTNSDSVASIKDVAMDLLDRIYNHKPRGPIVFVAHSLGGLVVKKAINMAHADKNYFGDLLKSVLGCVFLGVPHGGADMASFKTLSGDLIKLCTVGAKGNTKFAESIERASDVWYDIAEDFKEPAKLLQIHCVRELRKVRGFLIVDKASAKTGLAHEILHVTDANHVEMNKFRAHDRQRYETIGGAIKEVVESNFQLRKEAVNDRVLEALSFPTMDDRHYKIPAACTETFSWALEPPTEPASHNSAPDPHSFLEWLRSNDTIFWVNGKPGCGKSTLMKHVYDHGQLKEELTQWAGGEKCILAGCFFYEQGDDMQKSREGMLRTILHQILSSRRDLIATVFGEFFAESAPPSPSLSWSRLRDALELTLNNLGDSKICIFADGLDEYRITGRENDYKKGPYALLFDSSTSDDAWGRSKWIKDGHEEIADFFFKLGARDNIKICLASRDLQVFKDSYSGFPELCVHKHTKHDIFRYCETELSKSSNHFEDIDEFTSLIVKKSSGVFLWVHIVVKKLIDGKRDGDNKKKLLETLNELPDQLGDLYLRIMKAIPRSYLNESKRIFQLVLRTAESRLPRDGLDIITLFLAERGHCQVGNSQELPAEKDEFHPQSWEELKPKRAEYERCLKSRCGALLEGTSKVEFMHQTAKEFISNETVWHHIFNKSPGFRLEAEVDLALLSGCVGRLKCQEQTLEDCRTDYEQRELRIAPKWVFSPGRRMIDSALGLAVIFERESSAELLQPYRLLLDELDKTGEQLANIFNSKDVSILTWIDFVSPAQHLSCLGFPPPYSFLSFAMQAGLNKYITSKLASKEVPSPELQGLLYHSVALYKPPPNSAAMRLGIDILFGERDPNTRPEIINALLQHGADPNYALEGPRPAFAHQHTLWTFLLEHQDQYFPNLVEWCNCVRQFILHGADATARWPSGSTAKDVLSRTLSCYPEHKTTISSLILMLEKKTYRAGWAGLARFMLCIFMLLILLFYKWVLSFPRGK